MSDVSRIAEDLQHVVGTITNVATRKIEAAQIGAFAAATRDPNPVYTDPEAARRSKWAGVIAPPTFVGIVNGEDNEAAWSGFGSTGLNGGERYEFIRPVRPGQVITAVERVESIRGVVGRSGEMLIIVTKTEYHDEEHHLLARRWGTTIRK